MDAIERTSAQEDSATADIVERMRSGDDLASAELYVMFYRRVHRYLLVALKNPDDAEEAAQQVFVKVLETIPTGEPLRQPLRVWLFHVVRNHAIDHQRRSGYSQATEPSVIRERQDADLERASAVLARDGASGFQSIIESLPRNQQRVIVLRYVYDMTNADIADVLGTSRDAVRQMHVRSMRSLAAQVTRGEQEDIPVRAPAPAVRSGRVRHGALAPSAASACSTSATIPSRDSADA